MNTALILRSILPGVDELFGREGLKRDALPVAEFISSVRRNTATSEAGCSFGV